MHKSDTVFDLIKGMMLDITHVNYKSNQDFVMLMLATSMHLLLFCLLNVTKVINVLFGSSVSQNLIWIKKTINRAKVIIKVI